MSQLPTTPETTRTPQQIKPIGTHTMDIDTGIYVYGIISLVALCEVVHIFTRTPHKLTEEEQDAMIGDCIVLCRKMHDEGVLSDLQLLTVLKDRKTLLEYCQAVLEDMIVYMPHITENPRVQFILDTNHKQLTL